MKQVFYKGLLALTIAFGVTSCDKNELDDIAAPSVGVVINDEYSKVSFEELGNSIVVPKLKSDEASKTAALFPHIYSSNPQTLIINQNGGDAIYTGTYAPNNIGSINPASIILANAEGYTATSSNASNTSDDVVLGFLPYTSTVDFDLSASASIQLEATLKRGFLIVNVEAATENLRVQSATVQVGDGAKTSLILDSDGTGDYYGYLADGSYNVDVTYLLNGDAVVVSTPSAQVIANGVAYTIELTLEADNVVDVGSRVATSTGVGTEAALSLNLDRTDGGDINDDDDLLDSLERIVTTTYVTIDDVDQPDPDVANGAWSVVSDVDVDVDISDEESTEAILTTSVNDDGDLWDTITRVVTTTTTSIDDVAGTPAIVPGVWTILVNNSEFTPSEDNAPGTNPADTLSEWAYSHASLTDANFASIESIAGDGVAALVTISRSRTVVTVNGDADADLVLSEERIITDSAYVIPNGVDVWAKTGTYGGEEVLGAITFNTPPADTTVPTYTKIGTQAYSVNAAGDVETLTVNDAPDVEGTVNGQTRNVETSAALLDQSRVVSTEEDIVNPNYAEPSTDLVLADFTEDFSNNTFTAATGEQFRLAYTTVPATGYQYQIWDGSAYGALSDVFSAGDDDAQYAAAAAAAIVVINGAN